jgi:hypothetical protein
VAQLFSLGRYAHHYKIMTTSKRRFIGISILTAAVLAAAAFQVFGHGLIVKTEQNPSTPPELAAKGIDIAGGEIIDYSRITDLGTFALVGLVIALYPTRRDKTVA